MKCYPMKYEDALCLLFDCGQDEDPLKLANARIYDNNIDKIEDGKGYNLRFGLYASFRKIQIDFVEGKTKSMSEFIDKWEEKNFWIEKVFTSKTKREIHEAIDVLDNIIKELQRENVI